MGAPLKWALGTALGAPLKWARRAAQHGAALPSAVPSAVLSAVTSAAPVDGSQAWVARGDAVAAEGGGSGVVPPEAGELRQLERAAHLCGEGEGGRRHAEHLHAGESTIRCNGQSPPLAASPTGRPKLGRSNQVQIEGQSAAISGNQRQSTTIKGNQCQSTAVTSCHEPNGFRQPNRCLMVMKADSTRSALASLGEAKTGLEKENQASILARSTSSSSGMASQSGVFCRRAGHPKLGRGVPN